MAQVKWKTNLFGDADAQKVADEIGEQNTTPEEILEKAKDPDSELHKCFEWDDSKAAHQYRLQQARTIMCNLIWVTEDKKDEVRVFYNLTFERSEYHPTKMILKNPDEYKALVSKCESELKAITKKYTTLKDEKRLMTIFDLIDGL